MDQRALGTLFMVGFYGTEVTSEVRELVDELNPCGLILFSRNIEEPLQLARLTCGLQRHTRERLRDGLFLGLDQEGGRVRRLPEPFSVFPPALDLASSPNPQEAVRTFARVTARELRLVGLTTDFVPVMDVLGAACDPCSTVIGDRSYGRSPDIVAALGCAVIETMREEGIIPCSKHFPGHGGTVVDSHVELPVDRRGESIIRRSDLAPFTDAVGCGVEMIMTAHVLYPAFDPVHPATLSDRILGGLLRGEMGYDGVVVTDDLDMGAVSKTVSIEEAAVRSFQAGADILLVCNTPEKAFRARAAVLEAHRNGEISEQRLDDSLRRIRSLKSRFAGSMVPCDPDAVRSHFENRLKDRT